MGERGETEIGEETPKLEREVTLKWERILQNSERRH